MNNTAVKILQNLGVKFEEKREVWHNTGHAKRKGQQNRKGHVEET
jgi:hypothetical protein